MLFLSKFLMFILITLIFSSCAVLRPRQDFSSLRIGMSKDDVEQRLGKSWETSESKSGNGEINYLYGEDGYVWYDENNLLKGFASYKQNPSFSSIEISRASGYKFKDSPLKKIFLHFEPFKELRSEEAKMVYLENKVNIEKAFSKMGYIPVKNAKSADVIIVCKLGISDPKTTQEIVSRPIYNLAYVPAKQTTTNFYGSTGRYLGNATTTNGNPYGTFHNVYGGQHTETITVTTFLRTLEFYAFDSRADISSDDSLLWSTKVVSEGSSDDIRMLFPYLLYASIPTIKKSVSFKEYHIAGYHTGVFELIGLQPEASERSPANQVDVKATDIPKSDCNSFLKAIRYQGCN